MKNAAKKIDYKISQLQKKREKITSNIEELQDKLDKINVPKLKKNIGKYFKVKNSYSLTEFWWLYIKIVGDDVNRYEILTFETTSDEIKEITIYTVPKSFMERGSIIEISEEEFHVASDKMFKSNVLIY